jgi:hypothetical protein
MSAALEDPEFKRDTWRAWIIAQPVANEALLRLYSLRHHEQ